MGTDPAFLFYPNDWLGGTMTFSRHDKGAYMDLLMAQFNNFSLTLEDIKSILGVDYPLWDLKLSKKFEVDVDGFYNERLRKEQLKRRGWVASRSLNKEGKNQYKIGHKSFDMTSDMSSDMENRNRNKDCIIKEDDFVSIWDKYPSKVGRREAFRHFKATVKSAEDLVLIEKALDNYKQSKRVKNGFIQNGSTFFNQWKDWIELPSSERVCHICNGVGKFISKTGYEIICNCKGGK